ncbi:archaellin/type IV pilin N-terminal domain-containing protein [Lachnoclostridium sp. An138]|uniref:archaellin/type IV pilin N-terminal domain-containing protein n=1 Tax=Lachnoclostridium sp. An138 TaxID=1965560 RepID=UPI000B37151C|nr:Flp1 family type IVb pilin [Lachnoclostridium sp. An138]OUQ14717.1 hypothetical protein B5E82_16675 [Lachnoclostridium sp. An138]
MMNRLDDACIWAKVRLYKAKESVKEFFSNQDGVSNVVATIIVLLITVLLIAAFWNQLKEWVSGIMDQIFGNSFDDSGL